MSAPTDDPTTLLDPRLRRPLVAILLVVALSAFEGLAVAAGLPQLAADLGGLHLLPWVITSYMLTSGVSTVAAGALVDRLGVSALFRASVVVFVLGGVLAGLAPTMPLLVAARTLQGVGAGAVNAVGLTAVGLVFPRRLVGRAFAANANVWAAMSIAGPALAALLLTVASWRWIFLVNLPLGAVALSAGWSALPGPREGARGRARLPLLDLLLLAGFTFLVLFAVDSLSWASLPAGIGAIGLAAWVLHRGRDREGALLAPRHTVRAPLGPLGGTVALLLVGGIGAQSFVPLFVSGGRGGGTVLTAWSVVFMVLGWTSGANIGTRLAERVGSLRMVQAGTALVSLALVGVALVASFDLPLPLLFGLMVLTGVGLGASTNSALALLRFLVGDDELGRATAAHQFMRNLGFAVGNALMGAVLLLVVGRLTGNVELIREVISGGEEALVGIGAEVAEAIQAGYATGAGVSAAVAALAILPMLAVTRYARRARTADPGVRSAAGSSTGATADPVGAAETSPTG